MILILLMLLAPTPTLHVPLAVLERERAAAVKPAAKQQFVANADTVVELDGKRIKFSDVPADATIEGMDLAADKKTILKIRFARPK